MPPRRSHRDYTLGWICPLEIEQTAAIKMLDERHEPLEQERADYNTYTLGSIGHHNVVIAGLHQPGNSSATSVVTQIRNTFSDINCVLLVGIGGGVPVKTNSGIIRLGDVVVSKPAGEYPGVVQYDHGKAEVGVFKRTGALPPPPAVLLHAAQDFAVNRTLTDEAMDPLTTSLSRISSDRRLRGFQFPGRMNDFLYQSGYVHLGAGELCTECNCDSRERIKHDYGVDEAYVQVHRGIIASGELVIKNAMKRDQLAAQYGILCFETEAAGVLADMPCLVIRGVSDYCDSHKNDQWHGYAAATAAAYARELVLRMPKYKSKKSDNPTSNALAPHAEQDIGTRLSHWMKSLQLLTTGVQKPIEEQRRDLLLWLGTVFPDNEYHAALSLKLHGTCSWILHRTQFQEWLSMAQHDGSKVLWIRGGPGCGKTILTASIVEHLSSNTGIASPIVYFFCTSEDESRRDPDFIPRSWLAQLLNRYDDAVEIGLSTYEPNKYRSATTSEVWEILGRICQNIRQCIFIIDGLDECEPHQQQQQPWLSATARFLEDLWKFAVVSPVKILISSRKDAEIFSNIRSTCQDCITFFEYDIWPEDTSNDIMEFSKTVVHKRLKVNKDQDLIEEISRETSSRGSGMFLWVRLLGLQLDPGKNKTQLRQAVIKMPRGLEQTYSREVQFILRLDEEEKARAISILRWILFARRPLTVHELTEALLSEESSTSSYPSSGLPDSWDEYYVNGVIRKLCRSLIDVRGDPADSSMETHTVHFMHASVREFLTHHIAAATEHGISFAEACKEHEVLARTCLSYLCYEELTISSGIDSKVSDFPFTLYASREWSAHLASSGNISHDIEALVRKLLDPATCRWKVWSNLVLPGRVDSLSREDIDKPIPTGPLFWASYLGLRNTVQWLLSLNVDINASDKRYGSALQAAASRGHIKTLQLLIESGADVNISGSKYSYAIIIAVKICPPERLKDVIGILLEAGADIDSCDGDGRNALHYASLIGLIETAAFLIQHGACIDASDRNGWTALLLASAHGYPQLADLLVTKGANMEAVNKEGQTPLFIAVKMNHHDTLKCLLQRGARVNCKTGDYDFVPLHSAAANGSIEAITALVHHGALVDTKAKGQPPMTPLSVAAFDGHLSIVQFLIEHGAVVTDSVSEHPTPLIFGIAGKRYPVVKFFLENGAPVDTTIYSGYTPLHIAAYTGKVDIIQLLLEHDAPVDAVTIGGATPLTTAIAAGNNLAVSCLLEHNATLEPSTNKASPLTVAIKHGFLEIVQLLLQHGVNPEAYDLEQITPLIAAVSWGRGEIVRLLLQYGARPEPQNKDSVTFILLAIKQGHTDVVQTLIEHFPDLNPDPSTYLLCAIEFDRPDIARMLLEREPYKILAKDPFYVAFAASKGRDTITQSLIQHSMEIDVID